MILLVLSFIDKPLGWKPLANSLTLLMNLDNVTSIIWTRGSLSASRLNSLAAWTKGYWTKRQSVQRLETIDHDRKNILRVEGDLRRNHQIFLHTVNEKQNTARTLLETSAMSSAAHTWFNTVS